MSTANVLVVDDDRKELELISSGLEAAGYCVIQATDADEVVRLAREHKPGLTILDLQMASVHGSEIAAALRENDLPFLSLSSEADSDSVQRAMEAGAVAYLVKPLGVDQLVPAVQSALSRSEEARQLRETMQQMDKALSQGREVSMVVGILMERCNMTSIQAFDALRDEARSQRRKMAEIAKEYLDAAETLHGMSNRLADRAREKAQRVAKRAPRRFPTRVAQ
jgi:response regulator NasT